MQFFLLGLACIAAESPSPANRVNESVTLTPRPRCAVLIDRHVAKKAGSRAAVTTAGSAWAAVDLESLLKATAAAAWATDRRWGWRAW